MKTDVFSVLYPIYLLCKCLGLSQFTVKESNGKKEIELIKWRSLYKIFYLGFLSTIFLASLIIDCIFTLITVKEFLAHYIFIFNIYIHKIVFFVTIFSNEFYGKKLMIIWKNLLEVDEDQKPDLQLCRQYKYLKHYFLFIISLGFIAIILPHIIIFFQFYTNAKGILVISIYLIGNCCKLTLQLLFCFQLMLLGYKFKIVNAFWNNNLHIINKFQVIKIMLIYEKLIEMSREVNKIYSFPLLLNFGLNFYMVVTEVFHALRQIYSKRKETVELAPGLITIYGFDLIILFLACTTFIRHVSIFCHLVVKNL